MMKTNMERFLKWEGAAAWIEEMKADVARGIVLLEQHPRCHGWWDAILAFRDQLDMSKCTKCVLGRLFEDFDRGAVALGLYDDEERVESMGGRSAEHGFTLRSQYRFDRFRTEHEYSQWSWPWEALARIWIDEAQSRADAAREEEGEDL